VKAVRVHAKGGPEALQYDDVPVPEPAAGQALVKIATVGLNFIDVQYRTGKYPVPSWPFTSGMEASGVVERVGDGVTGVRPGDRVAWTMVLGTCAEYAAVAAARLVPVPAGVDLDLAAAVMLQGTTAHYLTHSTFPLQPGDTALVHAGAGGVGQLIIQAAKIRGARVITTAGTEAKAAVARGVGADDVIVYSVQDFETEVRRLTDGRGVDVVYDSVGKDTFDRSLNCLRPRGLLALFGFSSGPVAPFDPATLGTKGSLFLTRPGLNQHIATREELLQRTSDVFGWLASGRMRVAIDRVLPLAATADAHRALEARQTAGKVLLKVG
jgi:NADPH2:quinone reductase